MTVQFAMLMVSELHMGGIFAIAAMCYWCPPPPPPPPPPITKHLSTPLIWEGASPYNYVHKKITVCRTLHA